MIRQRQEATWPFLCILACLFILSATSPRAWDRPSPDARGGRSAAALRGSGKAGQKAPAQSVPELVPAPEPARQPAAASGDRMPGWSSPEAEVASLDGFRLAEASERVAGPAEDLVLPRLRLVGPDAPDVESGSPAEAQGSPECLSAATEAGPLVASIPDREAADSPPAVEDVVSPQPVAPAEQTEQAEDARPDPAWTEPMALLAQLEGLTEHRQTGPWATEVHQLVGRLGPAVCEQSDEGFWILDRLAELGTQSDELEARLGLGPLGKRLRRVRFALGRRLDLWRQVMVEGGPACPPAPWPQTDPKQLSLAVADVVAITADSTEGRAWQRYLLLDALRGAAEQRASDDEHQRQMLARRVLKRLTQKGMAPQQREFISTGPMAVLGSELRTLAADPVSLAEVMRHVETYEETGLPADAELLTKDCQRLGHSPIASRQVLGQRLQSHYRNANLRLVLTEELLNRLMPARDPEYGWVNDTVMGSPVRGRSLAFTEAAMRMVPDANRLRLALEVTGRVSSSTTATSGPATFYNNSEALYVARKPMELGTWGLRLWPADVEVRNATRLRGLETDFDPIPLVGPLAQGLARSKHESKRCESNREVERKVAVQARSRIDAEADARLSKVSERLRERVLGPLAAMSLGPEMIEANTSPRRLTMRLRVGDEDQLGGNTPRPWAPSDSLASFQIHESAMNNVLRKLELDGRTFTLPELRQWIAKRLNWPEIAGRKTDHDDTSITFAARDAVTVRCQDGRIILTLDIVELVRPPHAWTDFKVRAFYRPEIDGQSAKLVRDGVVHLIGRLDFRSQVGLRGLFGTFFSRDKPLDVTPERLSTDPRMADLAVRQFVISDGWIGVAVGPKRRGVPPEVVRRLRGRKGAAY